ncbi:MAG: hypothetical protein IKA74_02290 [Clostridia bacterium]|nr:hypothetical protein [Clostridia bacterium]
MKKYFVLFTTGALGYAALELLWRAYTHWSMMLAGGVCFALISLICKWFAKAPIAVKAIACGIGITAVELGFGALFNLHLGMSVWDYSRQPFNLWGQICPAYSALWVGISLLLIPVAEAINESYDLKAK